MLISAVWNDEKSICINNKGKYVRINFVYEADPQYGWKKGK